jgi:hypothetical protein
MSPPRAIVVHFMPHFSILSRSPHLAHLGQSSPIFRQFLTSCPLYLQKEQTIEVKMLVVRVPYCNSIFLLKKFVNVVFKALMLFFACIFKDCVPPSKVQMGFHHFA